MHMLLQVVRMLQEELQLFDLLGIPNILLLETRIQ